MVAAPAPPGPAASFFRIDAGDSGPWIGATLGASTAGRDRPSGAIAIAADETWLVDSGGRRHDLTRRPALRRVLRALLEHRALCPGRALSADALVDAGWPGERLIREAGLNRVYVAIATLREMGLRRALVHDGRGYLVDPQAPLRRG